MFVHNTVSRKRADTRHRFKARSFRLLILLAAFVQQSCSVEANPASSEAAAIVQVAHPTHNGSRTLDYTGTVHARIESEPGFRVAGLIAERLVDSGQHVRKGKALMRLDPANLDLASRAAHQRLEAAEAAATQATAEEKRQRGLLDSESISRSAYDVALAAAQAANANWKAAQDAARDADLNAAYATLQADADGVVLELLAQPGQVIAAGAPVLRFARAGQKEIVVSVPETEVDSLPKTGTADRYGHEGTVPVTLKEIAGQADSISRTFLAHYTLDKEAGDAPYGSTYTVHLRPPGTDTLSVPLSALYDGGKGPGVWVVAPDRTTRFQAVTVLELQGSTALISSPSISTATPIVSMGVQLIREGQTVKAQGAST